MFTRIPTAFLPIEDQGYLIAAVQLPDGASLERTQKALERVQQIARKTPGVEQVVTIAGISVLDGSSSLSSAGVAYIILDDWEKRGRAQSLLPLFTALNQSLGVIEDARVMVLPPPPIQGVGNAAGATMQVQLRDGTFDLAKLQNVVQAMVTNAASQSSLQAVIAPYRATVPQYIVEVDRVKTQTLGLTINQVFNALSGYLGASYVDQFNKFGRTFQIYVQADSQFRLRTQDINLLTVRNNNGDMIPLGTLVTIKPTVGSPLISLYNLYPSATVIGLPARGISTGQAMTLMEEIAAKTLPPGTGYEWTAMSYQEKIVGNQMFVVFGLGDAAGLSRAGGPVRELVHAAVGDPVGAARLAWSGRGAERRPARQQPLCADRPRAADRAVGQERDPDRRGGARVAPARQGDRRGRDRGGALPLPSDPDDLVRLHPGHGAVGARNRRRRQLAHLDRHHGGLRHAGVDLPRGLVRSRILRHRAAVRGMAAPSRKRKKVEAAAPAE